MTTRPIWHDGEQLPALAAGPFAGSCRLQPLRPSTEDRLVWARLLALDDTQPYATAQVELEELGSMQARRHRMALCELTRPFDVIHRRISDPQIWPEFQVSAARALIALETPIRIALGPDGAAHRPSELTKLRGEIPIHGLDEGHRVTLNREPRHWFDHLSRHAMEQADLEALSAAVWSRAWRPLTPAGLRRAGRFARREANPTWRADVLDGLQPEHWPLLECYAAITLRALEAILEGSGLHAARTGIVTSQLEELRLLSLNLLPDEEELQIAPQPDLRVVVRGKAGLSRCLTWRTTHPVSVEHRDAFDRLDDHAEKLSGLPGIETATWPRDLASSEPADPQRKFRAQGG